MAISLSDTIQVIQNSPDSLRVYFPPRYPGAILLFFMTLIFILIAIKSHARSNNVFFSVAALITFFFALDFCAYHGTITLSGSTQKFTLEERSFFYKHTNSYPLNSLAQVIVKAGRNQNREVALLMSSGEEVSVGDGYSSREGQFQAANAINSFLARNAQK